MNKFLHVKKVLLVLLFACFSVFSQSIYTKEALQQKAKLFGVLFMFDSDLLENVPFQGNINTDSLSVFIEQIEKNSAFKVEKQDNAQYLIIPKQKGKNYLFTGKVTDSKSKEPQVNALISIKNQNTSTFADSKGEFQSFITFNPSDTVEIRYLGYKPIRMTILDFQNQPMLEMNEDLQMNKLSTIEITGYVANGISFIPLKNKISISYNDMQLLPGQTDGDILTTLEAMPGINSVDSKAGNLNVRGSTADQSLMLLNDIPIYKRGHLFGAVSNINPSILDQVDIYRNSYDAEVGGRVGGVIKVATNMKLLESSKANFYSSMMDASGHFAFPVIKNKLTMSFSGRTSYPFGTFTPKLNTLSTFLFVPSELGSPNDMKGGKEYFKYQLGFRDFNYGLLWKIAKKHTVDLNAFYSKDGIESSIGVNRNPRIAYIKNDKLLFENIGIGTHLRSEWNSHWNSIIKLIYSSYEQDFIGETFRRSNNQFLGSNNAVNKIYDIHGGIQMQHTSEKENVLSFGIESRYYQVANKDSIVILQNEFFVGSTIGNNLTKEAFLHTLFGNYQWNANQKIKINTGIRANYYNLNKTIAFEPRLGINYIISENWIAKASAGIHKQYVTQMLAASMETLDGVDAQIWSLTDGNNVKILTGYQANAGVIFTKNDWVFDVDLYYKYTTGFSALNRFSIYGYVLIFTTFNL